MFFKVITLIFFQVPKISAASRRIFLVCQVKNAIKMQLLLMDIARYDHCDALAAAPQ